VGVNRSRSRTELECELLDTGVFDDDRYFDITVEYAKAAVVVALNMVDHQFAQEPGR
jgi:hypothetical protein